MEGRKKSRSEIFRVVFDHEAFVDLKRNFFPLGKGGQDPFEIGLVYLEIRKSGPRLAPCQSFLHEGHLLALLSQRDLVPLSENIRRDIDFAAVHQDMAMADNLPGSR